MAVPISTLRDYGPAALGFVLVVLAPLAFAAFYYGLVAAPRYVSEFRYTVRGGAIMQQSGDAAGGALSGAAGLVFAGDSFVLEDYVDSVEAFLAVEERLPIREILGRDGGDYVRNYDPNLPPEDMLPFWNAAVDVSFDAVTGISTVKVSLFTPEDAEVVGRALTEALKVLVDNLSKDARDEMLSYVEDQHDLKAKELAQAREAIERFRERNKLFSPQDQAGIQTTIEAALTQRINERQVEMRTLRRRTPGSPRVAVLSTEIQALEQQLEAERALRADDADRATTSEQLSEFDALQNDLAIARESYVLTSNLLQQAKANATLTQAQLVVFVPPRPPQKATQPDLPIELLKVFAVAFFAWFAGRTLLSSLRVI